MDLTLQENAHTPTASSRRHSQESGRRKSMPTAAVGVRPSAQCGVGSAREAVGVRKAVGVDGRPTARSSRRRPGRRRWPGGPAQTANGRLVRTAATPTALPSAQLQERGLAEATRGICTDGNAVGIADPKYMTRATYADGIAVGTDPAICQMVTSVPTALPSA